MDGRTLFAYQPEGDLEVGRFYYWRESEEKGSGHMVVVISAPPAMFKDTAVLRVTGFTRNGQHRWITQALASCPQRRLHFVPLGNTPQTEFTNPILLPIETTKPSAFDTPSYLYVGKSYTVHPNDLDPLSADGTGGAPTRLSSLDLGRARNLLFAIMSGKSPLPAVRAAPLPPPSPPATAAGHQPPIAPAPDAARLNQNGRQQGPRVSYAAAVRQPAEGPLDDSDEWEETQLFRRCKEADLRSIREEMEFNARNLQAYDEAMDEEIARGEALTFFDENDGEELDIEHVLRLTVNWDDVELIDDPSVFAHVS